MDEIKERLSETADACIKSYEAWREKKDDSARETLQDAVHELRKVAARLEIEIAVSERDEMTSRPIPIPPHRAARAQHARNRKNNQNDSDDGIGNQADKGSDANTEDLTAAVETVKKPRRGRRPKAASGDS